MIRRQRDLKSAKVTQQCHSLRGRVQARGHSRAKPHAQAFIFFILCGGLRRGELSGDSGGECACVDREGGG